ncbi:DUF2470 domain-containing protein [Micromonospora polyrhachis]|uniref:DUF2470 domain-containing protein n=1 Tax=Micromonospora polyrhachis TaxID=1282883 RepID=A0A7W7SUQ6_9ACTN|nr:DUF2470 domain-containing protein [Micromonospora polyrhachis]MBB4961345.1 hypothetical protein [Micromonospora polyrhachis]
MQQPSPAEIARTLSAGRLAGTAYIACRPGPHPVRHVVDRHGRVLLLVSVTSDLAMALWPAVGAEDVAMVLDVRDLPPGAGAPSLGRVWLSGWASVLDGQEARQAALDFFDVDPSGDLLDVGRGFALYRFEVAEVRLEQADRTINVDPEEYASAEPDPLHQIERELLADLADHHGPAISAFVRDRLGNLAGAADGLPAQVVRLDRYGFVVTVGPADARLQARLSFPRPVRDRADLARLLHLVLCGHRRHGSVAWDAQPRRRSA